ncbi:hypothetical protein RHODGE_RHODGE_03998 [Rhodoplanes serenus]|uniref:Uncharacterized protein n=1 Tax=Rhodoplanes serenus TaxID=200615 RepID=A0A447CZV7_9BRAD|nr:hypothetical protein [Rhodoplanes serenus]VCU10794.1 hypothetical protein RHODGE_RHODGE_03998 [Rhodoplanes serenus]
MVLRILGAYPTIPASDREVFIAGYVQLLERYPAWFMEVAADMVNGIPGHFERCPPIAAARGWLEKAFEAEQRYRERAMRPRLLNGPPQSLRPVSGAATRSGLCERYGISAVPHGWDALDVARAAAVHGDGFREHVERIVADQSGRPAPQTMFTSAVERVRPKVMTGEQLVEHYGRQPAPDDHGNDWD